MTFSGYEVIGIASDGEEAILMFKSFETKPKLILMDNRMPIKSGLEATKEILQIDKKVKIIFISADMSIKEEALSIGAFSFYEKPFSLDHLLDEIVNAINCY